MQYYLAPLQGLTDWIFREAYTCHINTFDKLFAPFIRVEEGEFVRKSQCNDILVESNTSQQPVPQFLGNEASSFAAFEKLCLNYGYTDANINLGCPFPMATKHGMGSGLLLQPQVLDSLLDEIFSATKLRISVKCRLGHQSPAEFEQLVPIFNKYPISEVIIHARVGKQLYSGEVLLDDFARYAPLISHPVCYNGDILSANDVQKITSLAPCVSGIMVGRGVLANPFLLHELKGVAVSVQEKKEMLGAFHASLLELCARKYSGNLSVLSRFEELWHYHADYFENGKKILKAIKKCKTLQQYSSEVSAAINSL